MSSAGDGRPDVVVVGAGLSGLAAAHRIARDRADLSVQVMEASDRPGGKILTAPFAGTAVDAAADAFLARVPEARGLCEELGLAGEMTEPATRTAELWCGDRLRPLPEGLVLGVPTDLEALERSGVVSPEGVRRAAEDLERPADGPDGDESVGSLVRRRLGDEVAEKLVAPLLGGVNAGDADSLSLEAGAPQLAAAARSGSSLISAARSLTARSATGSPAPVFFGLRSGTSTLVEALVANLGRPGMRLGAQVTRIRPGPSGHYELTVRDVGTGDVGSVTARAVVLAVPSQVAASLLDGLGGDLGEVTATLAGLEWASVVMTVMAFDAARIPHPMEASGYLVPAPERRTVTACSFASSKWAHLRRPGQAILRVSAGHAGDDEPVGLSDQELTSRIRADLGEHLGIEAGPDEVRITRWPNSLPQYRPGHLERMAGARRILAGEHPGVWLTGASYEGLGLPACIRQGWQVADEVTQRI